MVNFIWFTDDKLLEFYHSNHKNRTKQSLSHTCGDNFYTFQQNSAPAHSAYEMDEFLDSKTPDFMPPCYQVFIFHSTFFISAPDEVHHRSRVAADSTSRDRQACIHDTL